MCRSCGPESIGALVKFALKLLGDPTRDRAPAIPRPHTPSPR